MRELQIFVPQVADLFFLRDTRDAASFIQAMRQCNDLKPRTIYFQRSVMLHSHRDFVGLLETSLFSVKCMMLLIESCLFFTLSSNAYRNNNRWLRMNLVRNNALTAVVAGLLGVLLVCLSNEFVAA
jgi:hypothetical protein